MKRLTEIKSVVLLVYISNSIEIANFGRIFLCRRRLVAELRIPTKMRLLSQRLSKRQLQRAEKVLCKLSRQFQINQSSILDLG